MITFLISFVLSPGVLASHREQLWGTSEYGGLMKLYPCASELIIVILGK